MRNALLLAVLFTMACTTTTMTPSHTTDMNATAETYVKLVLALGEHDADYVDAYYGPPEWREAVKQEKLPLAQIHERATALRGTLAGQPQPTDAMLALRRQYLDRQTAALITRTEMLQGRKLTFDEESQALYDAVSPPLGEQHFRD